MRKHKLSDFNNKILHIMKPYTLEAIMIHVLGTLFHSLNESPVVRVSTLRALSISIQEKRMPKSI